MQAVVLLVLSNTHKQTYSTESVSMSARVEGGVDGWGEGVEQGGGYDGKGWCIAATTRGVTILRPHDSATNVSSSLDVF